MQMYDAVVDMSDGGGGGGEGWAVRLAHMCKALDHNDNVM